MRVRRPFFAMLLSVMLCVLLMPATLQADQLAETTLLGRSMPSQLFADVDFDEQPTPFAGLGNLDSLDMTVALPSAVETPEVPVVVGDHLQVQDLLGVDGDTEDFVELELKAGEHVSCWLYGPTGARFDIYLMEPGSTSVETGSIVSGWATTMYPSGFAATVPSAGVYVLDVVARFGSGEYTLMYEIEPAPDSGDSISGASRITTAVEVSKRAFPFGCDTVVIATGYDWPDALSGSALAGIVRGPILLTHADTLDVEVGAEIERLGAEKVYVIGGENAVSSEVVDALSDYGVSTTKRLSGASRYETCYEVTREVDRLATATGFSTPTAFIVTGANFPDALAVGPISASYGIPIILEPPSPGLSAGTMGIIAEIDCTGAIIIGGEAVVDSTAQTALVGVFGEDNVGRWSGTNRYETAWVVSVVGVDSLGLESDRVAIASGEGFADALAGSMLQSTRTSVMLLTPKSAAHPATCDWLLRYRSEIHQVVVIGGLSAVGEEPRSEYLFCAY